jgi:AraC-like DNA-binding protein
MVADSRQIILQKLDLLCQRRLDRVIYAQPGLRPTEPHACHPCPRMSLVIAGAKHIAMSDGERAVDRRVPTGSGIFMPPQGWTMPRYDSPREIIGVVFNKDHTRFLWSDHDGRGGPVRAPNAWHHAPVSMRGAAAHLIQALCARARETRGGEPPESDALLLTALVRFARDELARAPVERTGQARATWQALREYVVEHHHRPITRESVAAEFRLHPNYVSTLFVEQGGEPFARFLIRLRMERAAELLRSGDAAVAEVGAACGYTDPGYFIKAFRKYHRTTPGRFARG